MTLATSVSNWITQIEKDELYDPLLRAFIFGIFEVERGFSIYLTGSKTFDDSDDDWTYYRDFEPQNMYLELIGDEFERMHWEIFFEKLKGVLMNYFSVQHDASSIFRGTEAILVGFDDGDLARLV